MHKEARLTISLGWQYLWHSWSQKIWICYRDSQWQSPSLTRIVVFLWLAKAQETCKCFIKQRAAKLCDLPRPSLLAQQHRLLHTGGWAGGLLSDGQKKVFLMQWWVNIINGYMIYINILYKRTICIGCTLDVHWIIQRYQLSTGVKQGNRVNLSTSHGELKLHNMTELNKSVECEVMLQEKEDNGGKMVGPWECMWQ